MDCVVERSIMIAGMFAISMMALNLKENDKENAVPWPQPRNHSWQLSSGIAQSNLISGQVAGGYEDKTVKIMCFLHDG